jgi:hypothetical protein
MVWGSHVSLATVFGLMLVTFITGVGCGITFVRRADRRRWLQIDKFHTDATAAHNPDNVERLFGPRSARRLPNVVG